MYSYKTLQDKEKFFTCKTIDNESDLDSCLSSLKQNRNLVFRGVNEAKYPCYTSAQVRTGADMGQEDFNNEIITAINLVRKSDKIMRILNRYSKDVTDFQILALLQHFGFGTSILDFSYNINSALFFALDHAKSINSNGIDNYISLYFFDKTDTEHISIQKLNTDAVPTVIDADSDAQQEYGNHYEGLSQQTKDSFNLLAYENYCDVASLTVESHISGVISLYNLYLGLHIQYDINNERIKTQQGLFKFCPSSSKSWEERAYESYSGIKKHQFCLNINKSLLEYIKDKYLLPNQICSKTVYPQTQECKKILKFLLALPIYNKFRPKNCPTGLRLGRWKKCNRFCFKKYR